MQHVSKAELARELKLSRARLSQLCGKGGLLASLVRADGLIDREACLKRLTESASSHKGGWLVRGGKFRADIAQRAARLLSGAAADGGETTGGLDTPLEHQIAILNRLTSASEQAKFGHVLLALGLSKEHACLAGMWYACQISMAFEEVDPDDMSPTGGDFEWEKLFGKLDYDKLEHFFDRAVDPWTRPKSEGGK